MRLTGNIFARAIFLAALPVAVIAQDAGTVLSDTAKAMGAEDLRTIQYSGSGSVFEFGQSRKPNAPWPQLTVTPYTREIDFEAPASISPWAQQVDIWTTPYGFLKRAMTAKDTTVNRRTIDGKKYKVVTYTVEDKYPLNESRENPDGDFWDVTYLVATRGRLRGYINDRNMIEKVETWVDDPVLGDMLMECTYTAYRDFAGIQFPTRIVQKRGGFPVLDLTVSDVKPNAVVHIQPPQESAGAAASESPVNPEKVADGVFYIKGQQHSVAVEFRDYVAVIEGATIVTQETNKAFYEKIFAMPHTLVPDKLSRSRKKAKFETFTDKKVLTDGRRMAELYLQRGNPHADGLIFIYLPKEKILIEADSVVTGNLIENVGRLKLNVGQILPIHGSGPIRLRTEN